MFLVRSMVRGSSVYFYFQFYTSIFIAISSPLSCVQTSVQQDTSQWVQISVRSVRGERISRYRIRTSVKIVLQAPGHVTMEPRSKLCVKVGHSNFPPLSRWMVLQILSFYLSLRFIEQNFCNVSQSENVLVYETPPFHISFANRANSSHLRL